MGGIIASDDRVEGDGDDGIFPFRLRHREGVAPGTSITLGFAAISDHDIISSSCRMDRPTLRVGDLDQLLGGPPQDHQGSLTRTILKGDSAGVFPGRGNGRHSLERQDHRQGDQQQGAARSGRFLDLSTSSPARVGG